jgi:hypothetical protein
MTSYNYDSVNDVVTIYATGLPFDSLIDIYNTPHRIGIKLQPMTATEKAAKKEVYLVATSDSGSTVSVTGWIYDSNNNIVTDAFDGDNIIYLEYDERTISGSDTFGFWVVTDTYSQSQIAMTNNQIVLKVNSNGNLVEVALGANASTGSVFSVKAQNIDMTASEAINFLAGGNINLSGKNISISSDNFTVDSNGNVVSKSFTVVPSATQHGSFKIKDSEDNILGSWGGNYVYEAIEYHQLTPTRKEADYFISKADFFAQNVFSNGSGDVTGGFTTHMKWDHLGLELQLLTDPYAVNEEDRTSLLQFLGDYGAIDIFNYGTDGWGTEVRGLRATILDMFKTETLTKTVTIGAGGSFTIYFSAGEWQKNYYSCIGLMEYDVNFAYISQVKIDYNSSHQTLITLNNPRSSQISATMTFTFLYVPTQALNTYAQRN